MPVLELVYGGHDDRILADVLALAQPFFDGGWFRLAGPMED